MLKLVRNNRGFSIVEVVIAMAVVGLVTAAALVITEADVFLGAVSSLPEARGHHYAGTCIRALCDRFPDRRIFLMCRPEKRAFYEHLGFEKTDDYLEVSSSRK